MRGGYDNIELARTNAGPPPPYDLLYRCNAKELACDSKSTALIYC